MDKKKLFEDMNISDFEKGRKAERERILIEVNKLIKDIMFAEGDYISSELVIKRFKELKKED